MVRVVPDLFYGNAQRRIYRLEEESQMDTSYWMGMPSFHANIFRLTDNQLIV